MALLSASLTVVALKKLLSDIDFLSVGKAPPSTRVLTPSASWLANSMNLYAASACLVEAMIARDEPPFSELVAEPPTVDIWVTRHLPAPTEAELARFAGIQVPVNSDAMVPSEKPLNHSSDQSEVLVSISPSSSSFYQKSSKVLTLGSLVRLMVTVLPSLEVLNGFTPTSQVMESKKPVVR